MKKENIENSSPCLTCELKSHMKHCMESKQDCEEWRKFIKANKNKKGK